MSAFCYLKGQKMSLFLVYDQKFGGGEEEGVSFALMCVIMNVDYC